MEQPAAVYIAFDVFPRPKGSSSHIASMVHALSRRFQPAWLLCLGYGDMPSRQVEEDVIIYRHKLYHPNLLRRATEFMEFVREMMTAAGDEVRLMVFRDPWGGCPALAARPEVPAIFEVNALPSWELPYAYPAVGRNFALLAKLRDMERYCLLDSSRVITVSEVTREALAALGVPAERIEVIRNSAAEVFFEARPESCPLPELATGDWFGYVGSLQAWQGVETALKAFALVREEVPQSNLLIVHNGRKGPERELSKKARKLGLADRVLVRRGLSPPDLAASLARLRFTMAPLADTPRNTVQGCCPVKIVESMAAGAPVLASDLRVCRELITNGRDGLLIPPHSDRAWALTLRRMFTEPGLAARLAGAARETAQNSFTWPLAHAKLDAVFGRVAGDKSGGPDG